jgi:hypothetical protein
MKFKVRRWTLDVGCSAFAPALFPIRENPRNPRLKFPAREFAEIREIRG